MRYYLISFLFFCFLLLNCSSGTKNTSVDKDTGGSEKAKSAAAAENSQNSEDLPLPLDEPPIQIYEETPVYPQKAAESKVEGYAVLLVHIDAKGKVDSVRVKQHYPLGYGFDDAARQAAFKCKYKPGKRDGKPEDSWIEYRVFFLLD